MRTQLQAIILALIGLFFASPVPTNVLKAVAPARMTAPTDVYVTGTQAIWMKFVTVFMPWSQVVGIVIVIVMALAIAIRGMKPGYRRPIRSAWGNHGVVLTLIGVTAAMTYMKPPAVDLLTHASTIGSTMGQAAMGTTGTPTGFPAK